MVTVPCGCLTRMLIRTPACWNEYCVSRTALVRRSMSGTGRQSSRTTLVTFFHAAATGSTPVWGASTGDGSTGCVSSACHRQGGGCCRGEAAAIRCDLKGLQTYLVLMSTH